MSTNDEPEHPNGTPNPNLQDTLRAMLLRDRPFRSITNQFGSALPARHSGFDRLPLHTPPVYQPLPSVKIKDAGKPSPTNSGKDTGLPTGYVVKQPSPPPSAVSIPPKPDGASLAEHPDGWSECLLTEEIRKKILSTPGFPAPLVHPPKAHRIDVALGKGLGIFATRDLDMGDLICVERPLLVLPSNVNHIAIEYNPQDWTKEQAMRAVRFEWDNLYRRAFERLDPDAQAAFLSLANAHTEEGITVGICRTNRFRMEGLADIGEALYTGVCREFSRANHSCRPNVTRYFDLKSFAFYFSAARPIKSGEEITIAYPLPEDIWSVRQQELKKYGFDCDCPACGLDLEESDQNRRDIAASVGDLISNYVTWVMDKTLPEDEVIKTSRWWIRVIESEGLESSVPYEQHLEATYRAHIALGDMENAIKYGALVGRWHRACGEFNPPIESYSDPHDLQSRPDWAIRKLNYTIRETGDRILKQFSTW